MQCYKIVNLPSLTEYKYLSIPQTSRFVLTIRFQHIFHSSQKLWSCMIVSYEALEKVRQLVPTAKMS